MKLADEGKLSLDDYVSKYLNEFDSSFASEITIKQLLLHKGGFMSFDTFLGEITKYSLEEPEAPSLIVEARKIGKVGPDVNPGTEYKFAQSDRG